MLIKTKSKYFSGLILNYLTNSLHDGGDMTADVEIHCNNGILQSHRLVLASLSDMLLKIFKQDTWDEKIVIMLPDFFTSELLLCIKSFLESSKSKYQSDLFTTLGFSKSSLNFTSINEETNHIPKSKSHNVILAPREKENFEKEVIDEKKVINIDLEVKEEEENDTEYDQLESQFSRSNSDLEAIEDDLDVFENGVEKLDEETDETVKIEILEKTETKTLLSIAEHPEMTKFEQALKYFDTDPDSGDSVCKFCQVHYSVNPSIKKNRLKHLMYKHPEIYATFTSKNKDGSKRGSKKIEKKKKKEDGRHGLKSEVWSYFNLDDETSEHVCKICNFHVSKKADTSNLNGHMRRHHTDIYATLNVSKNKKKSSTPMDPEIAKHIGVKIDDLSKKICKICNIVFSSENIVRHLRRKHSIGVEKRYLCSVCGKVFLDSWNKNLHEQRHFITKLTKEERADRIKEGHKGLMMVKDSDITGDNLCPICGKQFGRKGALELHMKRRICQEKVPEGSFPCPTCKKVLPTLKKLNRHVWRSSLCSFENEKKPFPCDYCEKSFMTEKYLELHTRSHTGVKPYQCEKCSKQFKFMHRLNYHNCIE